MKDRLKELVKDLVGEYTEAERGWIDRFNLKLKSKYPYYCEQEWIYLGLRDGIQRCLMLLINKFPEIEPYARELLKEVQKLNYEYIEEESKNIDKEFGACKRE